MPTLLMLGAPARRARTVKSRSPQLSTKPTVPLSMHAQHWMPQKVFPAAGCAAEPHTPSAPRAPVWRRRAPLRVRRWARWLARAHIIAQRRSLAHIWPWGAGNPLTHGDQPGGSSSPARRGPVARAKPIPSYASTVAPPSIWYRPGMISPRSRDGKAHTRVHIC